MRDGDCGREFCLFFAVRDCVRGVRGGTFLYAVCLRMALSARSFLRIAARRGVRPARVSDLIASFLGKEKKCLLLLQF